MQHGQQIFVGLDIGSSETKCVIGLRETDTPVLRVIGMGRSDTNSLRKGVVIDLQQTTTAIHQAVGEAERLAGVDVSGATVAVGGSHIISLNSKGVIAVGGSNRDITTDDVARVEENAAVIQLPPNREIVHLYPRDYTIDGQKNIKDPIGMTGLRLEVDAHIVTASSPAMRNLLHAVEDADIQIHQAVVTGIAAAQATLTTRQMEIGTALVDIGGGTTSIAVYEEGEVMHTSILPIGSKNITNDIAIGLRTDLDTADMVKLKCVDFEKIAANPSETLRLQEQGSGDSIEVSYEHIDEIVRPRLREIFNLVNEELDKINRAGQLPGGIVITGGGAMIRGLDDLAKESFKLPAAIGKPKNISGLIDKVESPKYATAVGLMRLDSESYKPPSDFSRSLSRGVSRLKEFLKFLKP